MFLRSNNFSWHGNCWPFNLLFDLVTLFIYTTTTTSKLNLIYVYLCVHVLLLFKFLLELLIDCVHNRVAHCLYISNVHWWRWIRLLKIGLPFGFVRPKRHCFTYIPKDYGLCTLFDVYIYSLGLFLCFFWKKNLFPLDPYVLILLNKCHRTTEINTSSLPPVLSTYTNQAKRCTI